MQVKWKDIPGFEENYEVSSVGQIRNKKTGKLKVLQLTKDGYLKTILENKEKRKSVLAHRIVALAFIETEDQEKVIDHINRKRTDNRVENLRWSSIAENNINKNTNVEIKEINGKFMAYVSYNIRFDSENEAKLFLENKYFDENKSSSEIYFNQETWKDIKNFEGKYMISNFGDVKNKITQRVLKPGIDTAGYKYVSLNKKNYLIHRLVAGAFIPKDNDSFNIVDHLNRDKLDNNVSNLRWCDIIMNNRNKGLYNDDGSFKSLFSDSLGWFVRVCMRRTFDNEEEAKIWKINEYESFRIIQNLI